MRAPVGPSELWPRVRGRGEPFRALRGIALVVAAWGGFAACQIVLWSAIDPARYAPGVDPTFAVHTIARAAMWVVMTFVVIAVARAVPWRPGRLPLLLGIHALGATLAATVDTVWYRAVVVAVHPHVRLRPFAERLLIDLTGNAFLYLAVAALAYAHAHRRILGASRLHALRLEARSTRARLHVLGRQLQPHFLCNALNAIAELVHHDRARARDAIAQLRALLLGPLREPPAAEVTLADELAQLAPYLAIEQLRFGDRLTVVLEIADAARSLYVPGFVLQPLVENAVRHGLSRRAEAGRIAITAAISGDVLAIAVRDDGPGPGAGPVREGVGLGNPRLRLAELHGKAAGIELAAAPGGGAVATLTLPARSAPRPDPEPVPAPPWLPARLPVVRGWRLALAVGAGWAVIGAIWTVVRGRLEHEAPPVSGAMHAMSQFVAAAIFAVATLGLLHAVRRWPIDRPSRIALYGALIVASAVAIAAVRWFVVFGALPQLDETAAKNLQLDLSVCLAVVASAGAAVALSRARDRVVAAAEHEASAARAALEAQRMTLDPERVATTLDRVASLTDHDPEAADALATRFGQELRAATAGTWR